MVPKPVFLVGIALVLLATACTEDESSEPAPAAGTTATTSTSLAATTSTVTTTTTKPPGPSMVASFDGETCTYEGPEQVSPTKIISLSFTNQSDLTAGLYVVSYRSEVLEEIRSLIGSDIRSVVSGGPRSVAAELQADPGETKDVNILLPPGPWVAQCHTFMPGQSGATHMWLVDILEVGE
jgi:hypothetical protein